MITHSLWGVKRSIVPICQMTVGVVGMTTGWTVLSFYPTRGKCFFYPKRPDRLQGRITRMVSG